MAEPRLIDANALNERFDKRIKWLQLDVHDQYSLGLYHGAVTDKNLISEMSIVDAVPVVRCRDCFYYTPVDDNTGKCVFLIGENQYAVPDGYCYLGERKEGVD